jgi:bifunctional non-homologous end joining protein LigD
MALETYQRKRRFNQTPEPQGAVSRDSRSRSSRQRFVVQEHHASRLHFDFRLEMGGVLKSWAVPKGPTLDPQQKRLAVMTEDHPVQYLTFEGCIAEGNYGAGEMRVWDHGHYEVPPGMDAVDEIEKGRLNFQLFGEKLHGAFSLVRMQGGFKRQGDNRENNNQWLLMKVNDDQADPQWRLQTILPISASEQSRLSGTTNKTVKKVVRRMDATSSHTSPTTERSRSHRRDGQADGPIVPVREAFTARFKGEDAQAQVGQYVVPLTHLDKILWPDDGYTKRDLLTYYLSVADTILPYLKDRPLILKRYPQGVNGPSFFQHNVEDAPDFLQTVELESQGEVIRYALCNNVVSLLYLANLGNIAFNPWHSRTDTLDQPDWIVFDLDPGEVSFDMVREVALLTRDLLHELALESCPKTSGSTGMHVYVPLSAGHSYDEIALFAERFAKVMQKEHPEIVTLERSLKKREQAGVYFDYLQNAQGKTVVAPYAVRARGGATVSTPLRWSEVETSFNPQAFTMKTVDKRLKRDDHFHPVLREQKQTLHEALPILAQRLRGRRK